MIEEKQRERQKRGRIGLKEKQNRYRDVRLNII